MAPFRRHRSEDTNLNCGIAPKHGKMPFYCTHEPGRSSFDHATAVQAGIRETIEVEVMTLETVMSRHGIPDLLTVDAEGLDIPILQSTDFSNGPKVVCAEAVCGHQDVAGDLRALMMWKGYFVAAWAGSNMIFLAEAYRSRWS